MIYFLIYYTVGLILAKLDYEKSKINFPEIMTAFESKYNKYKKLFIPIYALVSPILIILFVIYFVSRKIRK